MGVYIRDKPFY